MISFLASADEWSLVLDNQMYKQLLFVHLLARHVINQRGDSLHCSSAYESGWMCSCSIFLLSCVLECQPLEGRVGAESVHSQRQQAARVWASGAVLNNSV